MGGGRLEWDESFFLPVHSIKLPWCAKLFLCFKMFNISRFGILIAFKRDFTLLPPPPHSALPPLSSMWRKIVLYFNDVFSVMTKIYIFSSQFASIPVAAACDSALLSFLASQKLNSLLTLLCCCVCLCLWLRRRKWPKHAVYAFLLSALTPGRCSFLTQTLPTLPERDREWDTTSSNLIISSCLFSLGKKEEIFAWFCERQVER